MPLAPLELNTSDNCPINLSSTPSSPTSCSSTPATSVRSVESDVQRAVMEIDLTKSSAPTSDDAMIIDDNTPAKRSQDAKRKASASKSANGPKRAKLSSVTPTSTPAKSASAAPTATSAKEHTTNGAPSLVELKGNKFVVQQKALALTTKPAYLVALAAFTSAMIADFGLKLDEWPVEHHGLVAKLIHESDKSVQQITRTTKKILADAIDSAWDEDDSQEAQAGKATSDRIPFGALQSLIESVADRVNYGIDLADLPRGLPEGIDAIPAGLQIARWEVKDRSLLPHELQARLEKRKLERQQIKQSAIQLFSALSPDEQTALLSSGKKISAPASVPVASTSAAVMSSPTTPLTAKAKSPEPKKPVELKPKKDKVKTEAELALEAEKARLKAEKDEERAQKEREKAREKAEKAAQKAEKDQAKAEEDAEKAKKREEREKKKQDKADKERVEREAKEKREAAAKKQQQLLFSFVNKETPPAQSQAQPSTSTEVKEKSKSDFDSAFLPFEPKGRTVAPINRFIEERKKKNRALATQLELGSRPDLSRDQCRFDLLSTVPSHRLLPRDNTNPRPPLCVKDVMSALNEFSATGATAEVAELSKQLQSRSLVQIKHFQFWEDHRPGYVGTWTKRSRVITPRTPLGKDTVLLNYEVDSEEEWEEEPEGEDVDNDEEEEGSEPESEVDSWLADDDEPLEFEEGYEGETPPAMEVDDEDVEIKQARSRIDDRVKKARTATEGAKKKKVGNLIPVSIGPLWEARLGATSHSQLRSMRIQFINDWSAGLDPMLHVTKPFILPSTKPTATTSAEGAPSAENEDVATTVTALGGAKEKKTPVSKIELAEQHWPAFIAMVHDSDINEPEMKVNLFELISKADPSVRKGTVVAALKSNATKKKGAGKKWVVKPELLEKFAPHLLATLAPESSPVKVSTSATSPKATQPKAPTPVKPSPVKAVPPPASMIVID